VAKGWHKTVKVLLGADVPVDPMDKSKVGQIKTDMICDFLGFSISVNSMK